MAESLEGYGCVYCSGFDIQGASVLLVLVLASESASEFHSVESLNSERYALKQKRCFTHLTSDGALLLSELREKSQAVAIYGAWDFQS